MNALRRYRRSLRARSFSGIDLLVILMSFVVCHYFYLEGLNFSSERLVVVVATLGLSYLVFAAAGLYRTSRVLLLDTILNRLTVGWFLVVTLVILLAYLMKIVEPVSRVWFGLSNILAYFGLLSVRVLSGVLLAASVKRGSTAVPVILIGNQHQIDEISRRLEAHIWTTYQVSRVFLRQALPSVNSRDDQAMADPIEDLVAHVEHQRHIGEPIAEVWIALPLSEEHYIRQIIDRLRDSSVDVCIVPDSFGMQFLSGSTINVAEVPVVNVSDIRLRGSAELFKRIFDRIVALVAVVVLSPILLLIGLCIRLDSAGPILFRQHRYGVDGKEIEVWKFRSMTVQENRGPVTQATRNDGRVTRVGAFLRRHSLDELPQFFNVLQGDMSIVGPRPHAVSHNEEYRSKIDGYMLRHKIKPGITGWAQVNGWRGETDTLEKMEGRVRYDLEYIRNWSAWLDIKIILLTIARVFSGDDAY